MPEQSPADPLLREILGQVLRRARQQQRRTLADVSRVAGVSVPYLSEIERGRKEPSSEMLGAVCSALDLDLIDLLSAGYIELISRQAEYAASVERSEKVRVLRSRTISSGRFGSGDVVALAA
jgi:transcriptional regulator with XRE-family HTH domain